MFSAVIVRRFPRVRELNLLFVHAVEGEPPEYAFEFTPLRASILDQIFLDVAPNEFQHLQYFTWRLDGKSFVGVMHIIDGSKAPEVEFGQMPWDPTGKYVYRSPHLTGADATSVG